MQLPLERRSLRPILVLATVILAAAVVLFNSTEGCAVVHVGADQKLPVSQRADCISNRLAHRMGIQRAWRS